MLASNKRLGSGYTSVWFEWDCRAKRVSSSAVAKGVSAPCVRKPGPYEVELTIAPSVVTFVDRCGKLEARAPSWEGHREAAAVHGGPPSSPPLLLFLAVGACGGQSSGGTGGIPWQRWG